MKFQLNQFNKQDNYNYKGWLISDHFIKRVVAMTGYLIVIWGFGLIIAFIAGFISGTLKYGF